MTSEDQKSEFDPRAFLRHGETGKVSPVRRADLQGLDEFAAAWRTDLPTPERMSFSAWQGSDDEHPAGSGKPAYRIVRKTVRTVVAPRVLVDMGNLRLSFDNGPVNWGEARFTNALVGREPNNYLVPEWGTLNFENDPPGYFAELNRNIQIEAHEETTPSGNYVELIFVLNPPVPTLHDDMLAAGRASSAPLMALVDLLWGERLLGPLLAEEVGETFEDWHWNRQLGGRTVSIEMQAEMQLLDGHDLAHRIGLGADVARGRDEEGRNRIKVASQWYWRAESEPDPVQRYISYWLVVEALALGESADISPIKRAVEQISGQPRSVVGPAVGRLHGLRSRLIHGKERAVPDVAVQNVRVLASALLELRLLDDVSAARVAALAAVLSQADASS